MIFNAYIHIGVLMLEKKCARKRSHTINAFVCTVYSIYETKRAPLYWISVLSYAATLSARLNQSISPESAVSSNKNKTCT